MNATEREMMANADAVMYNLYTENKLAREKLFKNIKGKRKLVKNDTGYRSKKTLESMDDLELEGYEKTLDRKILVAKLQKEVRTGCRSKKFEDMNPKELEIYEEVLNKQILINKIKDKKLE